MKTLLVILGVVLVLLLLYIGITVSLFRFAILRKDSTDRRDKRSQRCSVFTRNRGKAGERTGHEFDSTPFKTLKMRSFDGAELTALYLKADKPRGTLILFHGFHSTPRWDFGAAFPYFSSLGFDLLFPIQRGHGKSGGRFITYGIKERRDAVLWTELVNKMNGSKLPIYVGGISLGCTTAIMGAGVGYPENVRGIIADCGFNSPYGIFTEVMKKSGLPPAPFVWFFGILCRHIAGFDIKEYSASEALRHTDVPIVFIHGEKDRLIPCKTTLALYKAYKGEKHLLTVKNAPHAAAYSHGRKEYEAVLRLLFGQM